jgi:hypothetical protein
MLKTVLAVVLIVVVMMMVPTITTAVRHIVSLLESALGVRAYIHIHCRRREVYE